jgi:sec-independent protein translocase protein TatA/sec-independent protein translocase protein TatB
MGLSFAEIGVILLVALIVIGPDKLPNVAKSIGKGYAEFKRAFNDLKRAADINNVEVAPTKARELKSAYKSRWEEEALKDMRDESADTHSSDENKSKAPEESAAKVEDKPEERAKRSELIREADV